MVIPTEEVNPPPITMPSSHGQTLPHSVENDLLLVDNASSLSTKLTRMKDIDTSRVQYRSNNTSIVNSHRRPKSEKLQPSWSEHRRDTDQPWAEPCLTDETRRDDFFVVNSSEKLTACVTGRFNRACMLAGSSENSVVTGDAFNSNKPFIHSMGSTARDEPESAADNRLCKTLVTSGTDKNVALLTKTQTREYVTEDVCLSKHVSEPSTESSINTSSVTSPSASEISRNSLIRLSNTRDCNDSSSLTLSLPVLAVADQQPERVGLSVKELNEGDCMSACSTSLESSSEADEGCQSVTDNSVDSMSPTELDIYHVDTTLPYMNWDYVEEQLKLALEKEKQNEPRQNDRDEIRRKLANGFDTTDFEGGAVPYGSRGYYPRPIRRLGPSRLHRHPCGSNRAVNLEVCFLNEASNDLEPQDSPETEYRLRDEDSQSASDRMTHSEGSSTVSLQSKSKPTTCNKSRLLSADGTTVSEPSSDFVSQQARLQEEARLALAQVRPMARMQMQLLKQTKRKSPISDIVGVLGFDEEVANKLTRSILQHMNYAQLQVVVNDLLCEIEHHNAELMRLLMVKDEFIIAQDSLLVDVEDLTRRAKECVIQVST